MAAVKTHKTGPVFDGDGLYTRVRMALSVGPVLATSLHCIRGCMVVLHVVLWINCADMLPSFSTY